MQVNVLPLSDSRVHQSTFSSCLALHKVDNNHFCYSMFLQLFHNRTVSIQVTANSSSFRAFEDTSRDARSLCHNTVLGGFTVQPFVCHLFCTIYYLSSYLAYCVALPILQFCHSETSYMMEERKKNKGKPFRELTSCHCNKR